MRAVVIRLARIGVVLCAALWAGAGPAVADAPPSCGQAPRIAGCALFPDDNIWNIPIDQLPLSPRSAAYVASIGAGVGVHADFGSGTWEGHPIGIPFCVVPGDQPLVNVSFEWPDESDPGGYPIPPDAPIEGGDDRHVLVLDRDRAKLYELFAAYPQPDGSWTAGSGAIYDMRSNALRPAGWTSADAAGLPILPGLVRYDEVQSGEIRHAIRFTARRTQRSYVWPARHYASSITDPNVPPMGQRFRLRADFSLDGYSAEVRVILRAMQRYGIILADNGGNWFISGVPDERWDNDALHALGAVRGADFEAVDCSALMVAADSAQARCQGAEAQVQIPLVLGWNLLSLPLAPHDTAPTAALATIAGHYDLLYAYDAADGANPWRRYATEAPPYVNDLAQVHERMGLWVRASSPATLTLSGTQPISSTIALYPGWNLVGYPSLSARPISEALASLAGSYRAVYAYDASRPADPWQSYHPLTPPSTWTLTEMLPGRGYWLQARERCDWIVSNP